jgi:hypothetical protein
MENLDMENAAEIQKDNKFIGYPTNQLFSIIDNPADAEQALQALEAAGFASDTQVFHGEEGAHRIDASGAQHGRLAQLRRLRQSVSLDGQHAALYEQAVRQGHCVIAVHAIDSERREEARQILKAHGGHFINFYGRFTIHQFDL